MKKKINKLPESPTIKIFNENHFHQIRSSVVFDAVWDALVLFFSFFLLGFTLTHFSWISFILSVGVIIAIVVKRVRIEWKEKSH